MENKTYDLVKNYDSKWDCKKPENYEELFDSNDEEAICALPKIMMRGQDEINGNKNLEWLQNSYRSLVLDGKKKNYWPRSLEELYGTTSAFAIFFGLELIYDYCRETLREFKKHPEVSKVSECGYEMLCEILPEWFIEEYDYNFVDKLKNYIENDMFNNLPTLVDCCAHKPIDEILLYAAAVEFNEMYSELFLDDARNLVYDLLGDCDVEMILYSDMTLSSRAMAAMGTNLDDYKFSNWFMDVFYVKSEEE